jgi:uncharacterized protein (DUF2062 family)
MAGSDELRAAAGHRPARLRRFLYGLRTRHSGPRRDPIAVAVGVFIGCTPLYGLHLLISLVAADLLRLNRLKVYLAANISNPFMLPFLLFAEIQTGAWLRRGSPHRLTREAITAVDPWTFGLDLVLGSLAVGAVLAVALGGITWAALRSRRADGPFSALVDRAAERYAGTSLTAWEFANAKLRADPVYRAAVGDGLLPGGGTLLDIGCGQGLTLSLLLEARATPAGASPPPRPWPVYARLIGVETRPRIARLAAEALADPTVEIISSDVREMSLPGSDAILLFDVLHLMPREAQDALIADVRAALRQGGVVLVREADAGSGWRFAIVRVGNRLKALTARRWRQTFAFRTPEEWRAGFTRAGFRVEVFPGPASHPFGNTLYRLTLQVRASSRSV